MDILYSEINEYLKEIYPEVKITMDKIRKYTIPYTIFTKSLIPKSVPENIVKYINIPYMIDDLYQNNDILVFRFDKSDDDDTFISIAEYDEPEHTAGFINGVKILDETDIREQITANEYTGGYWDEEIHWVLDLKKLLV